MCVLDISLKQKTRKLLQIKISSDVMNAVKKQPEKMSEAVRGTDKVGDWFGVILGIMSKASKSS